MIYYAVLHNNYMFKCIIVFFFFYSFRVYYAFVTYSDKKEAERAIGHGNDDKTQVQLDIRFGERKQTQTPYYDLGNSLFCTYINPNYIILSL